MDRGERVCLWEGLERTGGTIELSPRMTYHLMTHTHVTITTMINQQEGICHDFENSPRIAKLLYYESSRLPAGETTSFDEYISRCDAEQVIVCKGGRCLCRVRKGEDTDCQAPPVRMSGLAPVDPSTRQPKPCNYHNISPSSNL